MLKRILLLLIAIQFTNCKTQTEFDKAKNSNNKEISSPNIILIMADDQGWGDTGYNGHPYLKTPNLDDMAASGAQFNRFYAASAVCSPTRGSVMTGRHPLRYGICYANCGHIKPEEITLAEMVKEKGYTTGHFGKWHLGTLTQDRLDANRGGKKENDAYYAPPWEHGFDECFVTESKVPTWNPMLIPPKDSDEIRPSMEQGKPYGTLYWTGPDEIETKNLEGDDSRVIMDRVIPFIEKSTKNKQPFLSIIWFHTPHLPVLAGEDYKEKYANLSNDQQHYYGVITALDEQVGRLRNKLKELGIAENTLICYTSDNGPEGKYVSGRTQGITKGLKGRKRSLYEGGIRVPSIMEWPKKINPGTKVEAPCFTSDYFTTVAKILDVDINKYKRPYDGIDILPFATGETVLRKESLVFNIKKQIAVMQGDYKLYSADNGKTFELYNIKEDASEKYNIADRESKKLNEMIEQWKTWKVSKIESEAGNDYQ